MKAHNKDLTWEDLTELMGVESIHSRADRLWERISDNDYSWVKREVVKYRGDMSDEEVENKYEEKRQELIDEECDKYYTEYQRAVEYVAVRLFREHFLTLTLVEEAGKADHFTIEPMKTWEDSAGELINTINGEGYFGFESVEDFVDSGPYDSAEDAVRLHLHYVPVWLKVYEGSSAKYLVERRLR